MEFDKYEKQLKEIINDPNMDEAHKRVAEADLLVIGKYKENNNLFLRMYIENVIKSEEKIGKWYS